MSEKEQKDELAVLFPNAKLTVNGIEIEVKEYSLLQQLQHRSKFVPFVNDLRTVLASEGEELDLDTLLDVIAVHHEDTLALMALSIDKPVEFVQQLNGEDAESLLMMWWVVNSDFFTRLAVRPMLERLAKQNAQAVASSKLAGVKLSSD